MKLYNSVGPNPRMVRMFMADKGIELPMETVDLMKGENRQAGHLARNPAGQTPALELDDGSFIAEITAICEYLDEKNPGGSLIGETAEQRAETRMWTRRLDRNICEPMANGFRFAEGLKLFESRVRGIPEAADGLKATAQDGIGKLDGWIAGKDWVCGDRFSMADVLLFCWIDFFKGMGQGISGDHANVQAWYDRVAARPSAAASA